MVQFNPGGANWSQGQNVKPTKPTEEGQSINRQVGSGTPTGETAATQAAGLEGVQELHKQEQNQGVKTESRPIGEKDIVDQLFKLQKPPTPQNKEILSSMLKHHVEASLSAFENIETLVKGKRNSRNLEAAVISYSKGLNESTKSSDLLSQFFTSQTQVLQNMQKLQTQMTQFQSLLSQQKGVFSPGLQGALAAVISELSEDLKKATKKSTDAKINLAKFDRGQLITDLKVFLDFLGGLERKTAKEIKNPQIFDNIQRHLAGLKGAIGDTLDVFLTQLILSKEAKNVKMGVDQFVFHQIPNPMTVAPRNIDLLIKKDPKQKKNNINPEQTRIVLKFDTPDLGEVSVIIDVKENKLWYVFQTQTGETKRLVSELSADLISQMNAHNFDVVGVKSVQKRLDIKKLLIPTLNLDTLSRIITEA